MLESGREILRTWCQRGQEESSFREERSAVSNAIELSDEIHMGWCPFDLAVFHVGLSWSVNILE